MTTLARLGLILEGEIVPCNWIERAFASIVSSIKTILPTFAYTDIGKSLRVVDSGETKPATVTLIQRQKPTQATSTRFTLAEGTYDWSEVAVGDAVKITVNGVEKSCEVAESSSTLYCNYPFGESSSFKFMSNGNIQAVSQPDLDISTVFVSGTKIGEVPVPELGWDSVREVPAVENADKGKYLKANDSTGALEWATAGGGGGGDTSLKITVTQGGTMLAPTYSIDKTAQEIGEAYNNGKYIFAYYNGFVLQVSEISVVDNACDNLVCVRLDVGDDLLVQDKLSVDFYNSTVSFDTVSYSLTT